MKKIYYLGTSDIHRTLHRVVLCDAIDVTPRLLRTKDIPAEDFKRAVLSGKLDLKHCYIRTVDVDYCRQRVTYRGLYLDHSHRNAQFMVVSHITIEDVPAGCAVIDNHGRLRLFTDSLIQSGTPRNTNCGDFFIRFGGCDTNFDYPNAGTIPTVAENISAFGRLQFEDSVEPY